MSCRVCPTYIDVDIYVYIWSCGSFWSPSRLQAYKSTWACHGKLKQILRKQREEMITHSLLLSNFWVMQRVNPNDSSLFNAQYRGCYCLLVCMDLVMGRVVWRECEGCARVEFVFSFFYLFCWFVWEREFIIRSSFALRKKWNK